MGRQHKVPMKPKGAVGVDSAACTSSASADRTFVLRQGAIFLAGAILSWVALPFISTTSTESSNSSTATLPTVALPTADPPSANLTDFIYVLDNALSPAFCDALMAKFRKDPRLVSGRTGGGEEQELKDSVDLPLTQYREYEEEVRTIRRAADLALVEYTHLHPHLLFGAVSPRVFHPTTKQVVKLDDELWEQGVGKDKQPSKMFGTSYLLNTLYRHGHLNMQLYLKDSGHYSKFHSEHMPHWKEDGPIHRVLLWMIYLNDVAEGGTTDFYYQNRSIAPKKGRLVIAPAAFTHTHRGEIPRSNDKLIVTSWLMWKNVKQLGWDKYAESE